MANTQYIQGPAGSLLTAVIPIIPAYASNVTVAGVFVNSNSAISSPTASHSVDGALTAAVPLISGNGQLVMFYGVDLSAGDITISWSGGTVVNCSFAAVVEGGTGLRAFDAGDSTNGGSGTLTVDVANAENGDQIVGFFGSRSATALSSTNTTIGSDLTSSANILVTSDIMIDGYEVDGTGDGFAAALAGVSVVVGSANSVTAPDTITVGDTAVISTSGLSTLTTATATDPNGNVIDVFNSSDTSIAIPNFNTIGQAACLLGTVTLTVGDGTNTASTTFELEPAAGYANVVGSGLTVPAPDNNYWNSGTWTEEPEDGDECYYPNDTVSCDTDGLIDSSAVGTGSYTFTYFIIDRNTGILAGRTNIFDGEATGDPSLTLPLPLGSSAGVAAAESNVPVSVCRASDMVQVYSGVVSWGSDGVVPSIVDAAFVLGADYSIAIEGSFMAKFTVTAV